MADAKTRRIAEAIDEIGSPKSCQVRGNHMKALAQLGNVRAPTELRASAKFAAMDKKDRIVTPHRSSL
jgi:hypothetical protein